MLLKRFIALLQLALTDKQLDTTLFEGMQPADWNKLIDYSSLHGLTSVSFSAFEKCSIKPTRREFAQWYGQSEVTKMQHEKHVKGMNAMAELCREAGADMLVLKGVSLASYYPIPEARSFGDLDIFTIPHDSNSKLDNNSFSEIHDKVNKSAEAKGVKVEFWDKHDVFNYAGSHVEHHSYFVNNYSKAGKRVNEKLKQLVARDRGHKVADNVYYPSADFNALFVMNHTIGHMAYEGAVLKNVVDWGLFLIKDGDNVHWDDIVPFLKEVKWHIGFNTLTHVAEAVLGTDFSRFYIGKPDSQLSKKVFQTIVRSSLHQETHLPIVKRVIKKTQRVFSRKWMYTSGLVPANFWIDSIWGSLKEHMERPEQI